MTDQDWGTDKQLDYFIETVAYVLGMAVAERARRKQLREAAT